MRVQRNFTDAKWTEIELIIDDVLHVLSTYGLTVEDVIDLCGGIPLKGITGIKVNISSQYKGALTVKVSTDQYEVIRVIDLDILRIDNLVMVVRPERRGFGIGTNLFLNQVRKAKELGFVKIRTVTRAPSKYDEDDQDWQGYYFWANFGFINREVEEFREWIFLRGRKENTLNELMQHEEGRLLWREEGFTWIGEFYLEDGSESYQYLRAYLERRNISWNWLD